MSSRPPFSVILCVLCGYFNPVLTAKNAENTKGEEHYGYLKSSRLEHGLLINFGSYKFQIRKFARMEPNAGSWLRPATHLFAALVAFIAVTSIRI